ncbi:MAG TPA: YeeE/YedE thiosulfate transporter family protein, partial [Tepidiformaceae bacterium]|nr:YeeE/YedE thiosulfate transporter family protein [Tepidiformaceae bacterium]
MNLILNGASPWHWAVGGGAIGLITLTLLYIGNRRLGVSTGFENLCAIVVNAPYFRRPSVKGSNSWRLPLLGGMLIGGFISALSTGGWEPFWDLGMFDSEIGWGAPGKVVWMFVGGVLIGFGTRLAGGCTSGHGIFGLSNLEVPSMVSTVAFIAAGVVTT